MSIVSSTTVFFFFFFHACSCVWPIFWTPDRRAPHSTVARQTREAISALDFSVGGNAHRAPKHLKPDEQKWA